MLLHYKTQIISQRMVHKNQKKESSSCVNPVSQQTNDGQDGLIHPKKLSNPVLESSSHRGLHRELLLSHRCGLLPEEKPELKRVLEQRRLEQDSEPPSDLELELRKRRHKLMEREMDSSTPKPQLVTNEKNSHCPAHVCLGDVLDVCDFIWKEYEQQELRRREDLQNRPEFVRVRENLRHITITGY